MSLSSISIVIPTLNSEKILQECLGSIVNQDYPKNTIETIVIDAKYTDGTLEIAQVLIKRLRKVIKPRIVNKFRTGDIRHCFADISRIKDSLDFRPEVAFEDGIQDLIPWVKKQKSSDLVEKATRELEEKGLTK